MLAWDYQPPMVTATTTQGKTVVNLRNVGYRQWEFDPTYPGGLTHLVPPGEYQNIIMRCNTALRSVFFRFRIWIFFYIAYMLFTIFWIIDLNSCYDCYDDRGFDPWYIWLVFWIVFSICHRIFYRKTFATAIMRINAELQVATQRFPGTRWHLNVVVLGRRRWARHMQIEIDTNATVISSAPGGYVAAGTTYGGGYQAVPTQAPMGAPPTVGYQPQQYQAPAVNYGVPTGGYQPTAGAPPAQYGAVPPPAAGGYNPASATPPPTAGAPPKYQ